MALFVYLEFRTALFTGWFSLDFAPKIDIAGIEYALIDVLIESSFGYRHAVGILSICNRERDSISDERNNSIGDILQFILSKRNTCPRFRQSLFVLGMCILRVIKPFVQKAAAATFLTAIAYVWRF
jgi:hypothetical protein